MTFDGKAWGDEIVSIVQTFVEREVAPLKAENDDLRARLKALEDRPMPDVVKGDPGEPGKDGADGKDGRGVKELLIDREGQLVATMDDGEMKNLGPIVGKDGRDGTDGKDGEQGVPGFNLEDFDVEKGDDGRTFVLKFDRGDLRHEYELTFPFPVYRGVFKQGEEYEPGDLATWGGSLWHCDEKTGEKPDVGPWTQAAKKGRDGKDAKPNG